MSLGIGRNLMRNRVGAVLCVAALLVAAGCGTLWQGGDSAAGGGRSGGRANALTAARMAESLVEVRATIVEADRFMPWRREAPASQQGYAVAVGKRQLLAPSSLVLNNTLVQIRRAGSGKLERVEAALVDPHVGLALLRLPESAEPLRPLEVVAETEQEVTHTLVRFGAGDRLQRAEGKITSVNQSTLSSASGLLLTYEVVSDLRASTPGTPVLRDGKLAGIVQSFRNGASASLVITPDVISIFLDAAGREPYVGLPAAGCEYASLVDPVLRRYLGVPEDGGGVWVVSVAPGGSVDGTLEPGDVILKWNGVALDAQGYYADHRYGRQSMAWLVAGKSKVGQQVPVEIVRDGQRVQLDVTMRAANDASARVPSNAVLEPNGYIVEGGIIFRELTMDYLQAQGKDWPLKGDWRLVYEALMQSYREQRPGQRIVFISAVLPDPVNIGYQGIRNEIVSEVNGKPVNTLRDVANALEADGALAEIALQGWGAARIHLDAEAVPAANRRIQLGYRIPSLRQLTQ